MEVSECDSIIKKIEEKIKESNCPIASKFTLKIFLAVYKYVSKEKFLEQWNKFENLNKKNLGKSIFDFKEEDYKNSDNNRLLKMTDKEIDEMAKNICNPSKK